MTAYRERLKLAMEILEPVFRQKFEIKRVSAEKGDFGDLESIRFDADRCGGFLDFWSSGMVQYELVDYISVEEIIPIVALEIQSDKQVVDIAAFIVDRIQATLATEE